MAVNLSPIWGAGAQLFDNSGNVLTGGKIYTYAAGTTTPATTYTSSSGITANSNPIILNSAGRVPYEIWLTDGISYKFVLKDSNDALIATYDGLVGINSNFIAYTAQQEIQTATAGQTVFNLTTMQYQPATNNLSVFVDGVNQYGPGAQYAYVETDSDTVTFVSGLHVGASVKFTTASPVASAVTNAADVAYDPPFIGAVGTNVELKLAQTVSVKDFGAVGDGTTDDTQAIQNAIDALNTTAGQYPYPLPSPSVPPRYLGGKLIFPEGTYKISEALTVNQPITIEGQGAVVISGNMASATNKTAFFVGDTAYIGTNNGWITVIIKDLSINLTNHNSCIYHQGVRTFRLENCTMSGGAFSTVSIVGAWATSWVKGCSLKAGSAKGIEILDNSNAFLLEGNRIGGYNGASGLGVYIRASQGVWVTHNDFEYSQAHLTAFGTSLNRCDQLHIINNWFEGAIDHSVKIDNTTYSFYGVTIRGNSVYGTPDGSVYLGISGGTGAIYGSIVDGNNFNSPSLLVKGSTPPAYIDVSVKNNYPDTSNTKCPAFKVYKTATQVIPSATWTKLTWGDEYFDRGGYFSGDQWQPATSINSLVQVKLSALFSAGITAGDFIAVAIYKNGVLMNEGAISAQSASSGTITVSAIDVSSLPSDKYTAWVYAQNGGTVASSGAQTWFEGMILDF